MGIVSPQIARQIISRDAENPFVFSAIVAEKMTCTWQTGAWRRFAEEPLSARQKTVLNRFLDGFEGHLTARKWAAIARCSVDTAQRDIDDLLSRRLLTRNPGGSKRTGYTVAGFRTDSTD